MFDRDTDRDRMPLPSEDMGDRVAEPPTGETEDYLVAREEGVPYVPATERQVAPDPDGGTEFAGAPRSDEETLEAEADDGARPRDDALLTRAIAALRASDVTAGDRIRLAARGATIIVRGEVESIDVADEILGLLGDVPGVDDVVDELEVAGV